MRHFIELVRELLGESFYFDFAYHSNDWGKYSMVTGLLYLADLAEGKCVHRA